MSTNSNLEVKVNELTNVIRNLSDKPVLSQNDVNELLNNLVKKVEDANLEGFDKLSNDVSDSLIAALENKYKDIKESISLFEDFIANVEKTVQNPKTDSEITRILNDIEALHSKMNSQELQMDSLLKSFEAMKNSSQGGQITKLCDEIVAISKSYDGIVEVLNNNFQDFLRRVEALSSREEFQRLRYFLESIEGSQNVIVSALNAVNDKQEEIKNLVKNTAVQNPEKYESLQSVINQMNRFMLEMPEKSDIDSIGDKISVLSNLFNEFKRIIENNSESDFRSVFQSQLNNIINRLEGLKTNNGSNVSEDIIKLYTSIADFKNALYSSIEEQLGGITTSFDAQFDKISNSVVNSALDSTEAITNLTGEVQKLNSIVIDGINSKTAEIKESFQRTAHENILTVVNSINGEILALKNDVASININEATSNLLDKIESIQGGLDFDSLILQINQIKETLNLEPIRAQLEELNQNDAVQSLSQKIDFLTEAAEKNEIASKLDLLLESINPQFVQNALNSINKKIEDINAQDEDKLKFALSLDEISNKISDVNLKITETNPKFDEINTSLNNIDDKITSINANSSKNAEFEEVQTTLGEIDNKINVIDLKLTEGNRAALDEINTAMNRLDDKINVINSNLSPEKNNNYEELSTSLNKMNDEISAVNSKITERQAARQSETEQILNEIGIKIENNGLKINSNIENSYSLVNDTLAEIKDKINTVNSKIYTDNDIRFEEVEALLNEIENKISSFDFKLENSSDSKFEEFYAALNEIKEIISQLNAQTNNAQSFEEVHASLSEIEDKINTLNSKLENPDNTGDEINSSINELKDKINSIDLKLEKKETAIFELGALLSEIENKISLLNSKSDNSSLLKSEELYSELNEIKEIISQVNTQTNNARSFEEVHTSLSEIEDKINTLNSKLENPDNSNDEINSSINELKDKISSIDLKLEKNYDDEFLKLNDNLNTIEDKINTVNSKIYTDNDIRFEEVQALLNEIENKISSFDFKLENSSDSKFEEFYAALNEIKEIISQLNAQTNNAQSFEEVNTSLSEIEDKISLLNSKSDNSSLLKSEEFYSELNEIKEIISQLNAQTNNAQSFEEVHASLSEIEDKINTLNSKLENPDNNNDEINSSINELKDKISSIDLKLEKNYDDEFLKTGDSLNNIENKINEVNSKVSISDDSKLIEIKESIDALLEFINSSDIKSINEKLDNVEHEILTDNGTEVLLEKVSLLENNIAEKLNSLKSLTENLPKNEFDGQTFIELIESVEIKLVEQLTSVETLIRQKAQDDIEKYRTNLTEALEGIKNDLNEGYKSISEEVFASKALIITDSLKTELAEVKNDFANYIKNETELLYTFFEEKNETSAKEILTKFAQMLSVKENQESRANFIKEVTEKLSSIFDNTSKLVQTDVKSVIDELKRTVDLIAGEIEKNNTGAFLQNKMNENKVQILQNITNLGSKTEEVKSEVHYAAGRAIDELKTELQELKTALCDRIENGQDTREALDIVLEGVEQKVDSKISTLKALMQDSTSLIDNKTNEIKSNLEAKSKEIQRMLSDKISEVVTNNNDTIRDELRIKTDSVTRELINKISKIEAVLVKGENDSDGQEGAYTLADVESDIAKIRLGIEKSNKLSNFKEFASRLIELKNINLENAKISRVIGADIMRFDSWLKNTTAKIELLANKIDKSEKIKMEDLKSRIMLNEKNQAMPQKLEEAIMSIYKKYRIQETKIDDLVNKIEGIKDQSNSFDFKEFIDLVYDNTQKTQSLMSRIDGMEDKMDLIQAKIDHIISSCIDE